VIAKKHWRMFCLEKGKVVEEIIFDGSDEAQKYVEDREAKNPEDLTLDIDVICQEEWYISIHGKRGYSGYEMTKDKK